MKKLLLSLIVVLMTTGAAMAQEQGKIKLGAGVVFGTKAGIDDDGSEKGGLGINVGGEYFITENISAAPSFTYFMKSEADVMFLKTTMNVSSLNLDGRYYFGGSNNVKLYGLAGISVAFAKVKYDANFEDLGFGDFEGDMEGDFDFAEDFFEVAAPSGSESDSKVGLNIGAGLVYPMSDKLDLNAQIKYNTPLEQLALQVGVAFSIN